MAATIDWSGLAQLTLNRRSEHPEAWYAIAGFVCPPARACPGTDLRLGESRNRVLYLYPSAGLESDQLPGVAGGA